MILSVSNTAVSSRRSQTGLSLLGLIFWAMVVAMGALVALRVLPTVNEYHTIQRAIERIAKDGAGSVAEVRSAFDRTKQTEYSITTIEGKDLDITKQNDRLVISYAYNKEIELVGPVYLLIKYRGSSAK